MSKTELKKAIKKSISEISKGCVIDASIDKILSSGMLDLESDGIKPELLALCFKRAFARNILCECRYCRNLSPKEISKLKKTEFMMYTYM